MSLFTDSNYAKVASEPLRMIAKHQIKDKSEIKNYDQVSFQHGLTVDRRRLLGTLGEKDRNGAPASILFPVGLCQIPSG